MLAVFDAPPGVSFRFGLVLNAASSSAEDPAFQTIAVKVGLHLAVEIALLQPQQSRALNGTQKPSHLLFITAGRTHE